MIFKRKIYETLLSWKNNAKGSKALLIEGARRVGKSTIAEEFAKNEYKSYLKIDFSKATAKVKNYFRNHLNDLDNFFQLLQAEYNITLYKRKSLVIFDEIQKFPKAREAIKTLVEDGRYDFLETGSLISIHENVEDIIIPSEERSLKMFPMDFEEFCTACGESQIIDYIKFCFKKGLPLEDSLHQKAMLLTKQYMIVGGMPKPLSAYLENNKSFLSADIEKRDILELYRKDIRGIKKKYGLKVLQIFDQIPGYLSKKEKRVVLNTVTDNAEYENFYTSFFWLKDSMICNECFNCNDPNVGLTLNEDRTYVKCYMGDTGLLLSHTFSEKEITDGELYKKLLNDRLSINEGMFFENLAAQMLTACGHDLYFYTHYSPEFHRNDIEIDFLLSNGSKTNFKVEPLEVKSSKNYTTVSFDEFKKRFKSRVNGGYVIHPKNFKIVGNVKFIPIYMTLCL